MSEFIVSAFVVKQLFRNGCSRLSLRELITTTLRHSESSLVMKRQVNPLLDRAVLAGTSLFALNFKCLILTVRRAVEISNANV